MSDMIAKIGSLDAIEALLPDVSLCRIVGRKATSGHRTTSGAKDEAECLSARVERLSRVRLKVWRSFERCDRLRPNERGWWTSLSGSAIIVSPLTHLLARPLAQCIGSYKNHWERIKVVLCMSSIVKLLS